MSLLIIEDDQKIARVVKLYLEGAGFKVIHAPDGKRGLEEFLSKSPELVILDLMLPDIPGEEICRTIKEREDIPVIMLTAKSSEEERIRGFNLGADDYVVKPFSPKELVLRVQALLRRYKKSESSGKVMSFNNGLLIIDERSYEVIKENKPLNLTPTEFKLLLVLASSPDRVFTREELVRRALGYEFEGYERSIDAHIKNIRQKLGDDPRRPSFILTIYGVGYKFIGKKDV
ncbi:MAG: response regulator transcription factor [Thermodesulfovibrionales bacterium]|nr:response regulator transcription factor [Thermodesulfovibrionales bacterium]